LPFGTHRTGTTREVETEPVSCRDYTARTAEEEESIACSASTARTDEEAGTKSSKHGNLHRRTVIKARKLF